MYSKNNILIIYFKIFINFKGITFTSDETQERGTVIVSVPLALCNTLNQITFTLKVKEGTKTDNLESFINFLGSQAKEPIEKDGYIYDITFSNLGEVIVGEKKEKYQEYTVTTDVFIRKEKK